MKNIVFLLLIFSFSFGDPFALTKRDIETIRNAYDNKKIIIRYRRFRKFLKNAKDFDEDKKIQRVNSFVNKILPATDKTTQNKTDYWATPKEFLITGRGDCEDYALTKYFTLLKLGIERKRLYLAIVKVKGSQTMHMVLLYFKTPKTIPLVLDNLSWKVLALNKRKTLRVKVIFNEIDAHLIANDKIGKKAKIDWGKFDRWTDILKRANTKSN